jgi:hypothetical protein
LNICSNVTAMKISKQTFRYKTIMMGTPTSY